jgi:hypothetical protein
MSHPLKNKGFVNIGSSELADITINNLHLNPTHFKIFRHPLGYKFKDISKSNRILVSINKPLQLRPGMVVSLFNYELMIVSLITNPIDPDPSFVQIDINVNENDIETSDTTLRFIIKDTRNQEERRY